MRLGPFELPRALVIAVACLLLLGGCGCSVSVLRGNAEPGFPDWLRGLGPEPPPVERADLLTDCPADGILAPGGGCTVTIAPTDDPRRRLRLRLAEGRGSVTIRQPVTDPLVEDSVDLPDAERDGERLVDVVVGSREDARLVIACASPLPPPARCRLRFD